MPDMTIDGVVTLTAPMHSASFQRPPKGDSTIPCAKMKVMHLSAVGKPAPATVAAGEEDEEELDVDDLDGPSTDGGADAATAMRPVSVPFFPGNSVRGAIRDHCSTALLEALALAGEKISQRAYYSIRKGRAAVSGEAEVVNLDVIAAAHEDLFTGLFGVETRVPSKIETPAWVPIIDATERMVPERYRDRGLYGIPPWQLVYTQNMRVVDDLMAGRDALAERVWQGGANACRQWVLDNAQALADTKAAKEGSDEAKRRDFRLVFGVECLAPLTPMYARVSVKDVASKAHLGFVLLGMQGMLDEQVLGGLKRLGMGGFDADLNVTIDGAQVGAISVREGRTAFHEALVPYIEAAREALGQTNAGGIHAIHGQLTKPKPKPAAAAKKAAGKKATT